MHWEKEVPLYMFNFQVINHNIVILMHLNLSSIVGNCIGIIIGGKKMEIGETVQRKRAYCQPSTPQSNITNSFIRQQGSNFDIPHDTWLISISSPKTEESQKQGS